MNSVQDAREYLVKSFGNGILLLRPLADAGLGEAKSISASLGSDVLEAVQGEDGNMFLLMAEGLRVSTLEVRGTEDDWDEMESSVLTRGSSSFQDRLRRLAEDRAALLLR